MNKIRRSQTDGRLMEALLLTLRQLTRGAQWLCLVFLVFFFASSIQTIPPQETALVLRLGKLLPRIHAPGLLFVWPAPIDEVVHVQTGTEHTLILDDWEPRGPRIVREDKAVKRNIAQMVAEQDSIREGKGLIQTAPDVIGDFLDPVLDGYTLTGDWNILQGRFTLRYRITDPVAWYRNSSQSEALIRHLSYRAITHALSRQKIDRALTDQRDPLAKAIRDEITNEATRLQLGIVATALEMRDLAPPKQVLATFEDVINAKLFAKTLTENAEEYRLRQSAEAQGSANAIRQRSEAEAGKMLASAQGEASAFQQFLVEYKKAPDLLTSRLYSETIGYIMRQVNSATLLPPGSAAPNLLVEPSPDFAR